MIRIFRHYVPRSLVILGSVEAVLLYLSVYLGVSPHLFDFNPTYKLLVGELWTKALAYTVAMMVMLAGVGLYQRALRDDLRGLYLRIGVAFVFALPPLVLVTAFEPAFSIGLQALTVTFVASLTGVVLFRTVVLRYAHADVFRRRVMVLGAGARAAQLEQLRRRTDWQDSILLGYVPVPDESIQVAPFKLIERRGRLLDVAMALKADLIVVGYDDGATAYPVEQVLDCKMSGIPIVDLSSFFEQLTGRIQVDALRPTSLVFADGFIQAIIRTWLHRGFDIAVSFLFLLAAWPIMLLTAVAIWVEEGGRGPALYRQIRVGRNGRHFSILKFRSMRTDAERDGRPQWARAGDPRVTRVGEFIRKTRIDELPQLLNVLRGEMSFVGPRPERPEFVAELARKIPFYDLRHRVNPGITGWAQICYPYGASDRDAKEKLQYDLYYIKNYSLFLDVTILLQTAQVVLWGKGAR